MKRDQSITIWPLIFNVVKSTVTLEVNGFGSSTELSLIVAEGRIGPSIKSRVLSVRLDSDQSYLLPKNCEATGASVWPFFRHDLRVFKRFSKISRSSPSMAESASCNSSNRSPESFK